MEERNFHINVLSTNYKGAVKDAVDLIAFDIAEKFNHQVQEAIKDTQKICDAHLNKRESDLTGRINNLEDYVARLESELSLANQHNEKMHQRLENMGQFIGQFRVKTSAMHSSPFSVNRIFYTWQHKMRWNKMCNKVEQLIEKEHKKFLLHKYFTAMAERSKKEKYDRDMKDLSFRYDTIHTSMVSSYETEINKLRLELQDAYKAIKQEEVKRTKLEDDVRRLLLKNMTSMNMEALHIFKQVNKGSLEENSLSLASLQSDDSSVVNTPIVKEVQRSPYVPQQASVPSKVSVSSALKASPAPPTKHHSEVEEKQSSQVPNSSNIVKHEVFNAAAANEALDRLAEKYRFSMSSSSKLSSQSQSAPSTASQTQKGEKVINSKKFKL